MTPTTDTGSEPPLVGPGGSPSGGLRPWLAGVVAAGALLAIPLMLVDRAPADLRRAARAIDRRLIPDGWWQQARPLLPDGDVVVHIALFGTLALVAALVAWSWPTVLIGQAGVFVGAFALELLQPVVTQERNSEVGDIISNVVGQALGLSVALLVIHLHRRRSRRRSAAPPSL